MENYDVDWPVTTTLDSLEDEIEDINNLASGRLFIWTSVTSLLDRSQKRDLLENAGLIVITCLPCWHLLACKRITIKRERIRMVRSIFGAICTEDPEFRGRMFGYYPDRIKWYIEEWNASRERMREYLEEGDRHD